jgi:predicted AAA+ superfamily ATPase
LIYGRRKTGKTFLARKYFRHDLYFVVTRDSRAFYPDTGELKDLEGAVREALDYLKSDKRVVIDEFQRLPERYWDYLATVADRGVLLLLGSSFRVMTRLVDRNSPLLGLVLPYKLNVISYADALASLRNPLLSVILRDPWTVRFVKDVKDVQDKAYQLYMASKGLIGEVFEEEERQLTALYEAVLLALAEGEWNTPIIANSLSSRGLRVTPSTVSSVLDVMAKIGLVDKLPLYKAKGKARFYYRVSSPILSLMLYAEAKYNVSSTEEVGELPLGREAQFSVGELLAEAKGLTQAYSPYEDIDVVLLDKGRPVIGYEVKVGSISKSECERAKERIRSAGVPRVGVASLAERPNCDVDEALGPEDLFGLARAVHERPSFDGGVNQGPYS